MTIAQLKLSGVAVPPLTLPRIELPEQLGQERSPQERSQPLPRETTISVVADHNPKRPGTTAHARFALYATCATVGEYLDAGGRRAELAWDISRGYISVE